MSIDLIPATRQLADLVRNVRDEQLADPTPCSTYSVGDLLDHIDLLSLAFTEAAEKSGDPNQGPPPEGDAAHLAEGWQRRIPDQLGTLGEAWTDPDAWTGMTNAGGIEMPGEIGGVVALEEVIVHGWDLAAATGQPYEASADELAVVLGFFASFGDDERGGVYASARASTEGMPLLERAIAESGRDPGWCTG
jgi:uncharacterized protein (TIGR03086 family)